MKKIIYAVVLVGLFSACNNAKTNTEAQTPVASQGGLQTTPTATTESKPSLLTNPEHGQPGHDCALPVGAPLNQQSSTPQTATPAMAAPQPVSTQPVATQSSGAQNLNPAHGQPGHDCAKPVGAPLS